MNYNILAIHNLKNIIRDERKKSVRERSPPFAFVRSGSPLVAVYFNRQPNILKTFDFFRKSNYFILKNVQN
jgi:hypothetical protein